MSENQKLLILLAWQAGEISEGVASKLLGVPRIEARLLLEAAVTAGTIVAKDMFAEMKS